MFYLPNSPKNAGCANPSTHRLPCRGRPIIARIRTSCQCICVPHKPISTQFAAEMSRPCLGRSPRFPARCKRVPTTEEILPSLVGAEKAVEKPVGCRGNTADRQRQQNHRALISPVRLESDWCKLHARMCYTPYLPSTLICTRSRCQHKRCYSARDLRPTHMHNSQPVAQMLP